MTLLIASPKQDVKEGIAFRSDRNTLKLDATKPSHADFLKYTFPDNPSCPMTDGESNTRVLFEIYHELNYTPAHLVYFYNYNFESVGAFPGTYVLGNMLLTAANQETQEFLYDINDKKLTIYYRVTNNPFSPGNTLTYNVTGYKFGFKYLIYSNRVDP